VSIFLLNSVFFIVIVFVLLQRVYNDILDGVSLDGVLQERTRIFDGVFELCHTVGTDRIRYFRRYFKIGTHRMLFLFMRPYQFLHEREQVLFRVEFLASRRIRVGFGSIFHRGRSQSEGFASRSNARMARLDAAVGVGRSEHRGGPSSSHPHAHACSQQRLFISVGLRSLLLHLAHRKHRDRAAVSSFISPQLYDHRSVFHDESSISVLSFRTSRIVLVCSVVCGFGFAAKGDGAQQRRTSVSIFLFGIEVHRVVRCYHGVVSVGGVLREGICNETLESFVRDDRRRHTTVVGALEAG
jgi:hypothetical protein